LHKEITRLRKSLDLENVRIRLLGVSVSNLETDDPGDRQLELFSDEDITD
jgi:hypothetical protein